METFFCLIALTVDDRILAEFGKRLHDLVKLNADIQAERMNLDAAPLERWQKLAQKHRLACELLNFTPKSELRTEKDQMLNVLVRAVPDLTPDFWLEIEGKYALLEDEVWHYTKWDGLVRWFRDRGILAEYASEEDLSIRQFLLATMKNDEKKLLGNLFKLLDKGKVEEAKVVIAASLLF